MHFTKISCLGAQDILQSAGDHLKINFVIAPAQVFAPTTSFEYFVQSLIDFNWLRDPIGLGRS